ncbi:MAG: DUF4363 family protein [Clostridia bacterium]|nr:DUF4363 family protein [Clostridia bacterium]
MKNKYACILAGIFLFIMIGASVTNNIYVKNTFENINSEIASLPDDLTVCAEKLPQILDLWEERRIFLDLTISKPELQKVSELFEEAIIAASHGNASDYETAMARLGRAIADIKDFERISAEMIF